ncbi:MAG: prepilin-type N-terminal cleavage/methylation domain-containing protein [Candidatus Omnitrophica bacterium]|nr:prepilin-type N-terminal cleavage/methylation domain-containing protein [Candidatus Omnitrophota bacterium]
MNRRGFTLLEIILVVVVVTILATIAVPNYAKSKRKAIAKEAISSLKLIAAAERIYRMENDFYLTSCSCSDSETCKAESTGCNALLKLMLNTTNWLYSVSGSTTEVIATATYRTDSSCTYTFSSDFSAEPAKSGGTNCP